MKPPLAITLLALFAALLPLRAGSAETAFRVRMLWLPQAEFAGFYLAAEDGLYEQANLRVKIEHPRPDEEIFDTLKNGEADLIVAWPLAALCRAAAGDDLVNAGQLARSSALMLIARQSSGINRPEDMANRRIGLWPTPSLQSTLLSFLAHYGVHRYTVVPVYTNVDLFLYGGVDVTVGVHYDEYYRLFAAGIDPEALTVFRLNDAFPKLVDDGLYCTRQTYEADPEALDRFLAATLEGWRRAFADPGRALRIVRRRCRENGVPYSYAHQRWMLNSMKALIFPNGDRHDGQLDRASFDECLRLLKLDAPAVTYASFAPAAAAKEKEGGER